MEEKKLLRIGKIVGVHGLYGNLKVYSYAESSSFYDPASRVYLKRPQGRLTAYVVKQAQSHKNIILLSLENVNDRDQAEVLVKSDLFVEKTRLPELEEGTYYWGDLIGLNVFSVEGDYLGRLDSIFETGSNDVYVIKNDAEEILIPALASVVISIDLSLRTMRVKLPEGL